MCGLALCNCNVHCATFDIILPSPPLCAVDTLSWTELQSLGQKQAIEAATSPLLMHGYWPLAIIGSLLGGPFSKPENHLHLPPSYTSQNHFAQSWNETFLWGELRMKPAGVPSQSHNLLHVSHTTTDLLRPFKSFVSWSKNLKWHNLGFFFQHTWYLSFCLHI